MPIVESIRTSQTPWSKAVDITLPGANEKIAKLGEQALQVPFNPEDPEGLKVTLNITGEGRSKGAEAEPTIEKMIERLR